VFPQHNTSSALSTPCQSSDHGMSHGMRFVQYDEPDGHRNLTERKARPCSRRVLHVAPNCAPRALQTHPSLSNTFSSIPIPYRGKTRDKKKRSRPPLASVTNPAVQLERKGIQSQAVKTRAAAAVSWVPSPTHHSQSIHPRNKPPIRSLPGEGTRSLPCMLATTTSPYHPYRIAALQDLRIAFVESRAGLLSPVLTHLMQPVLPRLSYPYSHLTTRLSPLRDSPLTPEHIRRLTDKRRTEATPSHSTFDSDQSLPTSQGELQACHHKSILHFANALGLPRCEVTTKWALSAGHMQGRGIPSSMALPCCLGLLQPAVDLAALGKMTTSIHPRSCVLPSR
jgi:hypothetical protein